LGEEDEEAVGLDEEVGLAEDVVVADKVNVSSQDDSVGAGVTSWALGLEVGAVGATGTCLN
jgi:hypothetical protein